MPVGDTGETLEPKQDAGDSSFDPEKAASELMELFDETLRGDLGIDQQEREAFTEQFAAALRDVVDAGDYATDDTQSTLQDGIDQLKQLAAEADDADSALVRQLTNAIAPLELRKTKIAIEFSRRLQADGQESALAWYRAQTEEPPPQSAEQFDAGSSPVRALRDEVTNSRSRRLRGPPGRK